MPSSPQDSEPPFRDVESIGVSVNKLYLTQ